MNPEQVIQALVDPNNGVIVKMIDRIGKLEGERASIAEVVGQQSRDIDALDDRTNRLEQGTGQHIIALEKELSELKENIDRLRMSFASLADKLDKMEAAPPKRSRKKKAEPEPEMPQVEPEVPQVEPEVVDPEAPAYEPGLVPDEVAGVKITGNVVMSIRNNIKVLTLQLAKTLNTEYPPELYDFVAGLTDDEAAAIAEKFPA